MTIHKAENVNVQNNKVKISKEVAAAIESVWSKHGRGFTRHMILTNWSMLSEEFPLEYKELQAYAAHNPIEYMQAIYIGYEVEQTVEEQLLSNYESVRSGSSPYEEGWKVGFITALNIIGMKVKGINA